ncbi:MAG TPA: arginine--tRNA ligase [Bacilli bacterium]|nr:arginine--tRNA ligase [Bacilli bacterium]
MKEKIEQAIKEALQKANLICEQEIVVEIPSIIENGDYSSNVALKIAKQNNNSPIDIANVIKKNISLKEIIKIEIKNPGFLNFFVDKEYLFKNISQVLEEKENYGSNAIGKNKKINLEFVSANPTGIIHLGNARGGAYGDSLARILKFSGYEVNKEYYVNDSGNQVHNLGLSLKSRYLELCDVKSDMPKDGYFGDDIIKLANNLYEENNNNLINKEASFFEEYAIKELLAHIIADLKEYNINYDTVTSEKEIRNTNYISETLSFYEENKYVYQKDGATWFKGTMFGAPRDFVLIKSDKSYTYVLPDIAHHLKTLSNNYDKLINVLGADHHGYVPVIKSTLKALGVDLNKIDIKLLQLVKLVKDGQEYKMSKRSGTSVTLKELIDEVGVNATRYFFASRSLDTQMDFDIDLAKKQSNENPVYYVCYAYARISSVLREKSDNISLNLNYENIKKNNVYKLLEKIYNFPDVVKNAAVKELPHLITNYCYELANLFHIYYSNYRIITDNEIETAENLNLIKAVRITLGNALNLIGVDPPEKM